MTRRLPAVEAEVSALRAQLATRNRQDELARIMMDAMFQFMGILDREGVTLAVNRSSLQTISAKPEEVIGRPFWQTPWWTVSPELQGRLKDWIRRAADGEFVRQEVQHSGGGSQEQVVDVDFSVSPVRGPNGQVDYLVVEGREITARKRAEAEIVRKNEEISGLYARLKEVDQLKSHLFANVSHEFRTPLTLMMGLVETWLDDVALSAPLRAMLTQIQRHARVLQNLVNELLDLARMEASKLGLSVARIDLARLVREVAGAFSEIAGHWRLAYTVRAPEHLWVSLDAEKVQRILSNLLGNALKFTPEGGQVAVDLRAEGDQAVLDVSDSGPGIPPALRQRIFERFYQIESGSTRRYGGTGLGLAIVHEFVTLHGGTVEVTDSPLGGADFQVRLPLGPAGLSPETITGSGSVDREALRLATAELEVAVEPWTPAPPPVAGEPRPWLLIVEDDPLMARFLAETFAKDGRVILAADGKDGLAKAHEYQPDLILADVMMPVLSGDEMVRAIRRCREFDRVPILMLTARADDELKVELLESGAQDYVQKPFLVAELRARVAGWLAVSRARLILQQELESRQQDVAVLASEVVQRQREVATALVTARQARDLAERASRAKSDFLNLVSHELRTPLTSLALQLHLLEEPGALPPESLPGLSRLQTAVRRLSALIDSLLQYARIQSGHMPSAVEPVDLSAQAVTVLDELRVQAERKGLWLRLESPARLPPLTSNVELVHLILTNLVGNAIKYTDRGGVDVQVAYREGAHRIAIRDTGPGIPEDKQAIIFMPFEQLEDVRHKHHAGVGLGLAIAREFVRALGGRIELASQTGRGSTFTVILPDRAEPGG